MTIHLHALLDRSGSMSAIKQDVIGGYNTFMKDQRELAQQQALVDMKVSLHQFDHEFETVYKDVELSKVQDLTPQTFVPRGSTALLDGIGKTIGIAGSTPTTDKVIIMIYTDGGENASFEFTNASLKALVDQKTKEGWQFIFLGANQDAFSVATAMGIARGSTMSVAGNSIGTQALYASASNSVAQYTINTTQGSAASTTFNLDDLEAQKTAMANPTAKLDLEKLKKFKQKTKTT